MTGNKSINLYSEGQDPRERAKAKRDKVLLWLTEYQYSTTSILSRVLGLSSVGQWAFYNRLVTTGLLRKIQVPTVREKLFILTRDGKDIACGLSEKALDYVTEPSKVTNSTVRHNLCVQLAVLDRLEAGDTHTFEKHLTFSDRDKIPDVVLFKQATSTKIALEIELSHKRINRVYRAFFDHLAAMKNGHYSHVIYIFDSVSLCKNYQAKFDVREWPVIERVEGNLKKTDRTFLPDNFDGLRGRFEFVVQIFDIKG